MMILLSNSFFSNSKTPVISTMTSGTAMAIEPQWWSLRFSVVKLRRLGIVRQFIKVFL